MFYTRKLMFVLLLAVVLPCATHAEDKYVVTYQCLDSEELSIVGVGRSDTATVIHMRHTSVPGDQFCLSSNLFYLEDEQSNKYKLKKIVGIRQGETKRCPLSGTIDFSLVFDPLPHQVEVFDLRAANERYAINAFWGIHKKSKPLKLRHSCKSDKVCLSKTEVCMKPDICIVKGQIKGYKHLVSWRPDTLKLEVCTQEVKKYHMTKVIKAAISEDGKFCFEVPTFCPSWTYIEGEQVWIPVVLTPGDVLEVNVDHLREVDMKVDYRSQKGFDVMERLMVADPRWVDWDFTFKRTVAMRLTDVKREAKESKKKVEPLVDYLSWKYRLSPVETHLLKLHMFSVIDEVNINILKKDIDNVYPLSSAFDESAKKEILDKLESSLEVRDAYAFLRELNTEDYSYFILPRQYLFSHIPNLYMFWYGTENDCFEMFERYTGKPLDEEWKKRIAL